MHLKRNKNAQQLLSLIATGLSFHHSKIFTLRKNLIKNISSGACTAAELISARANSHALRFSSIFSHYGHHIADGRAVFSPLTNVKPDVKEPNSIVTEFGFLHWLVFVHRWIVIIFLLT